MNVSMMDINVPIPYENNPRKNKKAIKPILKSLKEYGFQQPIVVDEKMVIIVGHTRLLAAKELGLTQVPVHIAKGLTEDQVRAYRIADNKTAEYADWDRDMLLSEIQGLGDLYTGFEPVVNVKEIGTQPLPPIYEVIIVECSEKTTQKDLYEKLIKEGHKCKVVTI